MPPLPPPAASSFESLGLVDDALRSLGTDLFHESGKRVGQLRVNYADLPKRLRDLIDAVTLFTNGEWQRLTGRDAGEPFSEDLRDVEGPVDASGEPVTLQPTPADYARARVLLTQMAEAPLQVAIPLYRGLGMAEAPQVGDEIDLGSVSSWTADRDMAVDYAQDKDWQDRRQGDIPVVLVLSEPRRGTDIAPVSAWADEAEVVTGGVVRVATVREEDGVRFVDVEQLLLNRAPGSRKAQALLTFAQLRVGDRFVPLAGTRKAPAQKVSDTEYVMLGQRFKAEPTTKVMRIGPVRSAGLQSRLPPREALWRLLLGGSGLGEYPADYQAGDAAYRRWLNQYAMARGPKPVHEGGELDAVNGRLGLDGVRRVSGPYEGFLLLTRGVRTWRDLANSDALRTLREVPGLEMLHLPESVYDELMEEQWLEQINADQLADDALVGDRDLSSIEAQDLPEDAFEFPPIRTAARSSASWAGSFPRFNRQGQADLPPGQAHPHADGAVPGAPPPPVNEQVKWNAGDYYKNLAKDWGAVTPGQPTNLRFYDYQPYAQQIQDLARNEGYEVYEAGGKYGKPDLTNRNYGTGHLMIYDPTPGQGGDFGDEEYTRAWRTIHELAHAQTYQELNQKYGERPRMGKLGWQRSINDVKRAIEWEWLAAHRQRALGERLGYHVPDDVFAQELNTVMHDAVHRGITGQFTNPNQEGFMPAKQIVPLGVALRKVDQAGQRLGLTDPDAILTPEQKRALRLRRAQLTGHCRQAEAGDSLRYGSGVLYFCPETNEVLLVKRAEGVSEPGTWAEPGGHYRGSGS